jgi:hypothetical protein
VRNEMRRGRSVRQRLVHRRGMQRQHRGLRRRLR